MRHTKLTELFEKLAFHEMFENLCDFEWERMWDFGDKECELGGCFE